MGSEPINKIAVLWISLMATGVAFAPDCGRATPSQRTGCGPNLGRPLLAPVQMARGLIRKIPWNQMDFKNVGVNILDRAPNGRSLAVNRVSFELETAEGLHVSSATFFSEGTGPGRADVLTRVWGEKLFSSAKQRSLAFTIPILRERRPHWPGRVLLKLARIAERFERESTYINIELKPWPEHEFLNPEAWSLPPEIVASLRLIHEKNGRTAMEEFLDIEVFADGMVKIEPGNFAIAKGAGELAWMEIGVHLISQVHRFQRMFGREPFFVTYADRFSEKLFKKLGFDYLDPRKIKSSDGRPLELDENGHVAILKDEVVWKPMYATSDMLIQAMFAKIDEVARRQSSGRLLSKHLRAAVEKLKVALLEPEIRLGIDLRRVIWEVPSEARPGSSCPPQAKLDDAVAFQVSGNHGYVCLTCEQDPHGSRLVVGAQTRCPREIKCHSGICE